ncbi:MAG: hypothetical protein K0Q72_3282 [Armatimonadetes bacterium]|jgi:hypothetical protein|nr:hypothetical protein [Armatimonadota bacterium]
MPALRAPPRHPFVAVRHSADHPPPAKKSC